MYVVSGNGDLSFTYKGYLYPSENILVSHWKLKPFKVYLPYEKTLDSRRKIETVNWVITEVSREN